MADYLVIQIKVQNLDGSEITKRQLQEANGALSECCTKLEKHGYVSAELYNGDNSITSDEIEEMND